MKTEKLTYGLDFALGLRGLDYHDLMDGISDEWEGVARIAHGKIAEKDAWLAQALIERLNLRVLPSFFEKQRAVLDPSTIHITWKKGYTGPRGHGPLCVACYSSALLLCDSCDAGICLCHAEWHGLEEHYCPNCKESTARGLARENAALKAELAALKLKTGVRLDTEKGPR